MNQQLDYDRRRDRAVRALRIYLVGAAIFVLVNVAVILAVPGYSFPQNFWAIWPLLGWGVPTLLRFVELRRHRPVREEKVGSAMCESCAKPLTDGNRGAEADGSVSLRYCARCYVDGAFTNDLTLEQMQELVASSLRGKAIPRFVRTRIVASLAEKERWKDGAR